MEIGGQLPAINNRQGRDARERLERLLRAGAWPHTEHDYALEQYTQNGGAPYWTARSNDGHPFTSEKSQRGPVRLIPIEVEWDSHSDLEIILKDFTKAAAYVSNSSHVLTSNIFPVCALPISTACELYLASTRRWRRPRMQWGPNCSVTSSLTLSVSVSDSACVYDGSTTVHQR